MGGQSGRVVLVGDAAHALTPDIGQGGCLALEDAVTLAHVLTAGDDIATALTAYDHARRPRTQKAARTSARVGIVAEWRNPVAATIRNTVSRLIPSSPFRTDAPAAPAENPRPHQAFT